MLYAVLLASSIGSSEEDCDMVGLSSDTTGVGWGCFSSGEVVFLGTSGLIEASMLLQMFDMIMMCCAGTACHGLAYAKADQG